MYKITYIFGLILLVFLAGCTSPVANEPAPEAGQPVEPVQYQPTPVPPADLEIHDEKTGWELVREMKIERQVRMAAFLNENFGLTGGPNTPGIARTTKDGGANWTVAGNSSACLFGLEIIDDQILWECNYSDLRVSTDGGLNWSDRARGMGQPGCKLSAIDDQTAWYFSQNTLFKTSDGGNTRDEIGLPDGVVASDVAAISLRAADEGYVMTRSGDLYHSADEAQSWSIVTSVDLEKYEEMELMGSRGLPTAAIRFFDQDHGLIVLSLAGGGANKVVALRTNDAGQTWIEESVPAEFGTPYLSRDGKFLTIVSAIHTTDVSLYRYNGD